MNFSAVGSDENLAVCGPAVAWNFYTHSFPVLNCSQRWSEFTADLVNVFTFVALIKEVYFDCIYREREREREREGKGFLFIWD